MQTKSSASRGNKQLPAQALLFLFLLFIVYNLLISIYMEGIILIDTRESIPLYFI